jgi:hypothetical protein
MRETQTMHLQQASKQPTERRKDKVSQIKETTMMEDTSHPKDTSPQSYNLYRSRKKRKKTSLNKSIDQ